MLEEHTVINQFILLWVVIEPISVVSIFLGVTAGFTPRHRLAVAVRAVAVAAVVILFFIVAGEILLEALGVDLVTFQIAGGLVLFVFALSMILGRTASANAGSELSAEALGREFAIFPLGIPAIAGPGTMLAVVLLTDNHRFSIADQATTAAIAGAVLLITLAMLAAAQPIHRVIGASGANVISRIMGVVLAAIAVSSVLKAVSVYFKIAT